MISKIRDAAMGGLSREELREELRRFSKELLDSMAPRMRQEVEQAMRDRRTTTTYPGGEVLSSSQQITRTRRSVNTIRGSRHSMRQSQSFDTADVLPHHLSKPWKGPVLREVDGMYSEERASVAYLSESNPDGRVSECMGQGSDKRRRTTRVSMLGSSAELDAVSKKHSTYALMMDRYQSADSVPDSQKSLRDKAQNLVKSPHFEQAVGMIVLLNAFTIGFETELWARNPQQETNTISDLTEGIFCFVFTIELLIRFFAFRMSFFSMEGRSWNVLDFIMVGIQLTEQVLRLVSVSLPMHVGILRILKILRIVRVTRLIRSIHLFDDLRVIISSVICSAPSLCWSFALLLMLMYTFSLMFLQIVLSSGELEKRPRLKHWFHSLPRTIFTLFECIVGGVSWDEVVAPLIQDLGFAMAFLFSVYIAVSMFALMNLLTGVFVDKAMRTVREDKDMVLAFRIRDLFLSEPDHSLTWPDFQAMLDTSAMQEYFKQINVEVADAEFLFELLDADGSGEIDSTEIVEGCLKLRGPARALDLAMLHKDVQQIMQDVDEVVHRQRTHPHSVPIRTYPTMCPREGTGPTCSI